jgi:hypothetical protein
MSRKANTDKDLSDLDGVIEDVRVGKAWEADRSGRSGVGGRTMDLKILKATPPWDWPKGAGKQFLGILRDKKASPSARLLAAELTGDYTVFNDELARALLTILRTSQKWKSRSCRRKERELLLR